MNPCIPRPYEVKRKGIRGAERVESKEAYTAPTMSIIPRWQYFVPQCLNSHVSNFSDLHSTCFCFLSTRKASDVDETCSLVPATEPAILTASI